MNNLALPLRALAPHAIAGQHLDWLESEAVYSLRQVAGACARPVLLFSGSTDSIVLLRLAEKAFSPAQIPFPLLHIDNGRNLPAVLEFRDRRSHELEAQLIVRRVEDSAANVTQHHTNTGRAASQTRRLLEAIAEFGFDAVISGHCRDEEKARAVGRVLAIRDEFSQWDRRSERRGVSDSYNLPVESADYIRAFPISSWTESDVARYIASENLEVPIA